MTTAFKLDSFSLKHIRSKRTDVHCTVPRAKG